MALGVDLSILNQRGTPAFFSDIFANRPAFGFAGRVFISTDTGAIYEDTGTAWTLIADAGAGTTGTLQQVTTNGNSTNQGISLTGSTLNFDASGVSANPITMVFNTGTNRLLAPLLRLYGSTNIASNYVELLGTAATQNRTVNFLDASGTVGLSSTALTAGSVVFAGTGGILSQDNTNFFWDNTNKYLGIGNTGTPTAPLDIHNGTVGQLIQLNATSTNNSNIGFLNNNVNKWRIGNVYNAGANDFNIFNNTLTTNALTILSNNNIGISNSAPNYPLHLKNSTFSQLCIEGGTAADLILFNSSGTANIRTMTMRQTSSSYLSFFSANDNGTINVNNILNLSNSTGNVLIGTSTDNGNKLQVNGSTKLSGAGITLDIVNTNNVSGDNALTVRLGANCDNLSSYLFVGETGGVNKFFVYGNGTFATVSDIRLKKNINKINDNYLDKIQKLNIVNYNWNDQENGSNFELGMIAQEVEKILPNIVIENKEQINGVKYKSIQVSAIPYILIKAIQELNEKLARNNIN